MKKIEGTLIEYDDTPQYGQENPDTLRQKRANSFSALIEAAVKSRDTEIVKDDDFTKEEIHAQINKGATALEAEYRANVIAGLKAQWAQAQTEE